MTNTIVIGVDCATEDERTGVAFGVSDAGDCRIEQAMLEADLPSIPSRVRDCVQSAGRVLIAIDSPLGWPAPLGTVLAGHSAGEPMPEICADELFARTCDQYVHRALRKKPLEVGADRIARTARRALELLGQISRTLEQRVELAWDSRFEAPVAVIEVYPAATLRALGHPKGGYKRDEDTRQRDQILARLAGETRIAGEAALRGREQPDVLDAMICVLAGHDFLAGRCQPPENAALAVKEGWIWFRRPASA